MYLLVGGKTIVARLKLFELTMRPQVAFLRATDVGAPTSDGRQADTVPAIFPRAGAVAGNGVHTRYSLS
jgi:hypothetical protein